MPTNDTRIDKSDLSERLRERIRTAGPVSFHEWMQAALYDEREGYYCRPDRVRWGREGDYRTAPERSPLFAATFARYFARLYAEMGHPSSWTIVEAGAGAGDFAHGVLESLARRESPLLRATRYVIDEISPASRELLGARLSSFSEQLEFTSLSDLSQPIEGIIFSNELLDAFPVHRLIYRGGDWRELYVGLSPGEDFVWIEGELTDQSLTGYFESIDVNFSEGQIVEVNSDAEKWLKRAAGKVRRGFLISVDYGGGPGTSFDNTERSNGSLRGFHRHGFVDDLLANPGKHDLTTTVDWTQIKAAGERAGLRTIRFERLDEFLMQEGLLDELERSCDEQSSSAEVLRLRTSAREMIMPNGMASSFQVLIQQRN